MADIGTMQEQLQALEAQLGSSVSMVAAFDGELARMRETMIFTGREVNTLSSGISGKKAMNQKSVEEEPPLR